MTAPGRVTVALSREDLTALILGRATLQAWRWSGLNPEEGEPIDLSGAVVVGIDYDPACDEVEVYFQGAGLPGWAVGTYPSTAAVKVTHHLPVAVAPVRPVRAIDPESLT